VVDSPVSSWKFEAGMTDSPQGVIAVWGEKRREKWERGARIPEILASFRTGVHRRIMGLQENGYETPRAAFETASPR
jgi:hypothetical protein